MKNILKVFILFLWVTQLQIAIAEETRLESEIKQSAPLVPEISPQKDKKNITRKPEILLGIAAGVTGMGALCFSVATVLGIKTHLFESEEDLSPYFTAVSGIVAVSLIIATRFIAKILHKRRLERHRKIKQVRQAKKDQKWANWQKKYEAELSQKITFEVENSLKSF